MLTQSERDGLKEILDSLDDRDLFRLLETVTKRMFNVARNRSEAIETILACTEKPSDLLQRQKITKKVILNYLIKRQSVFPEWGKLTLVQKCFEIWQSNERVNENDYTEEQENKSSEISQAEFSQMGIEFSNWFFNILNTLKNFGPEHFWPNCMLSAALYSPSEQKEISLAGASDVSIFLANLIILDKYKFGANNSPDSVMVEMEQHGLVKIIVRGVLYQHSNCVGLFDFAFGLVRNPDTQYNYKIQIIKVKMQVNCGSPGYLPMNNQLSISQTA